MILLDFYVQNEWVSEWMNGSAGGNLMATYLDPWAKIGMWSVTHKLDVRHSSTCVSEPPSLSLPFFLSLGLSVSLALSLSLWDEPNQQIWREQEPNAKLPSAKEEIAESDVNGPEWMKRRQTPSKVGKWN